MAHQYDEAKLSRQRDRGNPRYDENIAVVRAVTTIMKGTFPGIGMASVERDHTIAPAIRSGQPAIRENRTPCVP